MTLSCPDLPCETFLRVPVKITVHVLAAGCQLSYREFYGIFTVYTCVIETCFGESFQFSCTSLVLKDPFPLEIIVVICMKMKVSLFLWP